MRKLKSVGPVSTLQVLGVFSARIFFDIINAIPEKVITSDNIRDLLGITCKQYYARHSSLKIGLIKRKGTELSLTTFGQRIYQTLLKIAILYRHSLELRAIDAIKSTAGPDNELKNLIEKLILDAGMKKLVS
jgi:hypothetical protein